MKPRWVIDTNVLVSALLFEDSVPGRAVFHVLDTGHVLQSTATLAELDEVLGRKKFDKYLTRVERDAFLARLARATVMPSITETIRACLDPKDDKFRELAVAGRAGGVMTGDTDLLA